jgi:hypothetical protein
MGYQGSTGFHPAITGGGGGGFYQTVQDEGVSLPQQPILDFQGAGVTVTNGVNSHNSRRRWRTIRSRRWRLKWHLSQSRGNLGKRLSDL